MDNLTTGALATFGLISTIAGYFFWSSSSQLQSALSSIIDLNSTRLLKENEKIVASGVISCINQSKPNPYSGNEFAVQIVTKEVFNRFMIKLKTISEATIARDFNIGLKSKVPVKVTNETLIKGKLVFEKLEIRPYGWEESLRSFSRIFEFFTKTSEIVIPDKTLVFVEGRVMKDAAGKNFIMASEVLTTPEKLFRRLRTKRNFALGVFVLASVGFLVAFIVRRALRADKNEFQGDADCKKCGKAANVVIKPCLHLCFCRKCFFSANYCLMCGQWISNYYQVIIDN